jgi:hypothetical protein
MADNDVSFRRRAVIEFLVKEEIPAADIHHKLQRGYGDVCLGASSVRRWVKHFALVLPYAMLRSLILPSSGRGYKYLLTYLLTYLLHGAESFLRS